MAEENDDLMKLFLISSLIDYKAEKEAMARFVLRSRGEDLTTERMSFLNMVKELEEIRDLRDKIFPPFEKSERDRQEKFTDKKTYLDCCLNRAREYTEDRRLDTGVETDEFMMMRCLICEIWESGYLKSVEHPVDFQESIIGTFWDLQSCKLPVGYDVLSLQANLGISLKAHNYEGKLVMNAYHEKNMGSLELMEYTSCKIDMNYTPPQPTKLKLKPAADKGIIAGIINWAHKYLDKYKEPCMILIISDDKYLIYAIEKVKKLGFEVVLAMSNPSMVGIQNKNAVRDILKWQDLYSGKKSI